jgi:hypothetical protein
VLRSAQSLEALKWRLCTRTTRSAVCVCVCVINPDGNDLFNVDRLPRGVHETRHVASNFPLMHVYRGSCAADTLSSKYAVSTCQVTGGKKSWVLTWRNGAHLLGISRWKDTEL